jgi:hypothetical protein
VSNNKTSNVKLGYCQVIFNGVDLGFTQGGVEVSVKTETHKVNVDQLGKSTINEYIMGREVTAKVPLAETTLENLTAVMPGTTLTYNGGTVATGTITITTNPTNNQTIVVNGQTVTFVTALPATSNAPTPLNVLIGASASATAANLAAALNAAINNPALSLATYSVAAAVVTVTYGNALLYGTTGAALAEGNLFTLATGTAGASITVSGAALSGGTDPNYKTVVAATGVGTSLLSLAKPLRLRPSYNVASQNNAEDFVIYLAMCSGSLQFAYKLENERIFNLEFSGYPDTNNNNRLFGIGV